MKNRLLCWFKAVVSVGKVFHMEKKIASLSREIFQAFADRDVRQLRSLNNEGEKLIALEFDQRVYSITLLAYVLAKIISKPRYLKKENKRQLSEVERKLAKLAGLAVNEEWEKFDAELQNARAVIEAVDKKDLRFVNGLFAKAQIKLAATLYAQGLSLGQAAALTGVEKREILDYSGRTLMIERVKAEMSIAERMKHLHRIFVP